LHGPGGDAARGIIAVEAEDAERTLYARTVEALDAYFTQRDNHLHYAVLFMSLSQQSEESNEHFIRSLHELVSRCSGWDQQHKEDMMRIRLLAGMKDKDLSRDLQVKDNITLDQIKQQLRTKEIIAQNQKAKLDGERQVFTVRNKQGTDSNQYASENRENKGQNGQLIRDCKYCSRDHVKRRCPANNKQCNKCQSMGHFSKVCRKTNTKRVNQIEAPQGDSSEEGDTFHVHVLSDDRHINTGLKGSITCTKWTLNFLIKGDILQARVDTGQRLVQCPRIGLRS